jgi:hypothetical protein
MSSRRCAELAIWTELLFTFTSDAASILLLLCTRKTRMLLAVRGLLQTRVCSGLERKGLIFHTQTRACFSPDTVKKQRFQLGSLGCSLCCRHHLQDLCCGRDDIEGRGVENIAVLYCRLFHPLFYAPLLLALLCDPFKNLARNPRAVCARGRNPSFFGSCFFVYVCVCVCVFT